jgi:N-acetylneuraminic acid mutarotase
MLFVLFICLLQIPVFAQDWKQGAEMPKPKSEMASAIIGDKIYVPAGINFWGSLNSFYVYNINTNKWDILPKLPQKINHIGMAAYNGKIYITGGFKDLFQNKIVTSMWMYDPIKKEFTRKAGLPYKRSAHSMITIGDKIYLIGGSGEFTDKILAYSPIKDTWEEALKPFPEAQRDHINLLYKDDKLYVIAGRAKKEAVKACWFYDFKNKEWVNFTSLNQPTGGQSSAIIGDKIHIVGGEDLQTNKCFNRHDIYDISTKKWSKGKAMSRTRHGMVSEVYQGKWYVIGGAYKANWGTVSTLSNMVEIYSEEQFTP